MNDLQERLQRAVAGRYVVEGELGRGGMATVFLARDHRHHRQVAIKVLQPDVGAAVGSERFLREIEIAAQLQHLHILPLYDSGEGEGLLYYVMPYVEGESLRDRLNRESQLSLEDAVAITRDVAAALSYAHSRGVVHRDIKPENIMLAGGRALVADFGIARALSGADGSKLTQTGVSLGTPLYMSPEQATASDRIDGRSDIYSLGCVLYELLAGSPPFVGPTAQAIIARHTLDPIPPIRTVRSSIPEVLEEALDRALAKVPADRFLTAQQFADALSVPEAVRPSTVRSGVHPPAPRPGRRRYLVMAAAGATVLVAAAAAALLLPGSGEGATVVPDRVMVAPFENMTGDSTLAPLGSMAADWITQGLQQTGVVDVVPSPIARQAARFVQTGAEAGQIRDPIRALMEETGAGTLIHGSYYRDGADVRFIVSLLRSEGGRPGAIDPVTRPLDAPGEAIQEVRQRVMGLMAVSSHERLRAEAGAAVQPPTYESYRAFDEGLDAYVQNDYRRAIPQFARAFELDSTFVLPLLYAALSQLNLGQRARSDSLLDRLESYRAQLNDHDRHWLDYLQAQRAGDREAALRAIRRAADLAPASKATYNAAYAALLLNRPREALALLDRLSPERGAMRGWLPYWVQLTDAHHRLGRHREELEAARRARALHPDRLDALLLELEALAALGQAREVNRLIQETGGRERGSMGDVFYRVALELRQHGQEGAAREMFDRSIDWYRDQPAAEAAKTERREGLASVLSDALRWDEADSLVRELAREAPDNVFYRGWLAQLAARRGDTASAARTLDSLATVTTPALRARLALQRARIAAALGRRDQAVSLLAAAFAAGLPVPRHLDWNFEALRDYPPLVRLTRPRE